MFVIFVWQIRHDLGWQNAFDRRYALSLTGIRQGMWWQFLTYQFLHGGWFHLVGNLLFLNSFGPDMEDTLGRRRFLLLFLGSGVFGGAVHLLGAQMAPEYFGAPVVGASAGLCGLLSAMCAIYSEEPMDLRLFMIIPFEIRPKYLLLFFALFTIGGAVLARGKVAHLAHLGGLVGGLLLLNLMSVKALPPPGPEPK
jgi:membrane associated rhomboid family serine protease